MQKILIYIFIVFLTTACTEYNKVDHYLNKKDIEYTADEIYQKAETLMQKKKYKAAIRLYEEVEKRYPYSDTAVNSLIKQIYCYYELYDLDNVIALSDNFLNIYPTNKGGDYILYMKGMSYYKKIKRMEKDQENAELALEVFNRLLENYPKSNFKDEIKKLTIDLNDRLAAKEMMIARYYAMKYNYVGALNHLKIVIKNHSNTNQMPEALYRFIEIFYNLGLKAEMKNYYKILETRYLDNIWQIKAQKLMQNQNKKFIDE